MRKRWWAILLFALLGAAIGWGASLGSRATYTSSAVVLVSPYSLSVLEYEPAALNLSGDQVVLDTQIQLIQSPQTLERVAQALPQAASGAGLAEALPADPVELREYLANNLSVRRVNSADMIEVSFDAADAELAAIVANEVVNQFLLAQREAKAAELERVGESVAQRAAALAEEAQAAELAVNEARTAGGADEATAGTALADAIAKLELGLSSLDQMDPLESNGGALQGTRAALSGALLDLNLLSVSAPPAAEGVQDNSVQISALVREAEVKANMHREMLQRQLEIRELANFVPEDARLVAAALPAAQPSNLPPAVLAVMGFLAFGLLGTLIAATTMRGTRSEEGWS